MGRLELLPCAGEESSMDHVIECAASPAIPHPARTEAHHKRIKLHVKQKLLLDLKRCEDVLKLQVGDLKMAVEGWSESQRWSPERYLRAVELEGAMRKGEVTQILDELQTIRRYVDRPFAADEPPLISTILTEEWEPSYIAGMRLYAQKNIRGEATLVRPIVDIAAMARHRPNIQEALDLIKAHDPDQFHEIQELVTRIKIFDGRVLRGESSTKTFGAMWLRVPPAEDDQVGYWVEHIVHEVSHIRLFAENFFDQLVLNPRDECKFEAPIRDDLRPMYGVFHAAFVLARMFRVFRRMSLAGLDARFRDRLQLIRLQFDRGLKTLAHPDARFTPLGAAIRDELETCSQA